MDFCASRVAYFVFLRSTIQFWGFCLLHLEVFSVLLFFVGANETYLRWIHFVAVFQVSLSLSAESICSVSLKHKLCMQIWYIVVFMIFLFINQQSRLKLLFIVPREFFIYVKYFHFRTYWFFFNDLRRLELIPYCISCLPNIKVFCCLQKWVARFSTMLWRMIVVQCFMY